MKTDDWIDLLAADAAPVDPHAPARRLAAVVGLGALAGGVWAVAVMGPRPFEAEDLGQAMLWWRWAYVLGVAAAAWMAFDRLSRPGRNLNGWWRWGLAPLLVMGVIAAAELILSAPADRLELLMGHSASSCPWSIAMLSLPTFIGSLWAMHRMAPTRPALAGAAAGALAGAAGALGYTLHCTELAAPFLLVWYSLGMALPMAAGALLGPRVLRW